jgi:hypothetical protein
MTLRGPDSTGSTPRSRRAYSGVGRGPAWSARAFVAIILAIRCSGIRHLVRPRRVNPARWRGPATLYGL